MNLNTVPKMGPPGGPIFGDRHAQLSKRTKEKHFHGPILGTVRRYQKWDRKIAKIHNKGRPLQQTKDYNCIYLSNQHVDLEQRRPRTCEALFQLTFRPQKWNLKAHMWYQLSPFPSSNVAICAAAPPRQHSPILRYSALLRYSVLCFHSITQCNWHDIETMAE